MKIGSLTLQTLLILVLACAHAIAADRAKVSQLVLTSRVDVLVAGFMKGIFNEALAAKEPDIKACYADIPDDSFRETAIDYFSTTMSDTEIDAGLAFFATPLGKRIAARYQGVSGNPPAMGLSREEFQAKDAFEATRIGKELLEANSLAHSAQAVKQVTALFERKQRECEPRQKAM